MQLDKITGLINDCAMKIHTERRFTNRALAAGIGK
jgi:hypothetical protein